MKVNINLNKTPSEPFQPIKNKIDMSHEDRIKAIEKMGIDELKEELAIVIYLISEAQNEG